MGLPLPITESLPLRWVSACGDYTVEIGEHCLEKTLCLAMKHFPNEVGTSLVGHYSDDGHVAHVLDLAPLSDDSRGARASFCRGVRGLKEFFANLFQETKGDVHYVGEWHSHPEGRPDASLLDDSNQAAISSDMSTGCPESILIIAGGDLRTEVLLKVYVYSRTRGKVVLKPLKQSGVFQFPDV